jgi:hypothetical protein
MAHPHVPAAVPAADPAVAEPPAAPHHPGAHPRNYRELLLDETNSPNRERLGNYMQGYRFEGGALPAPATLREQTVVLTDRQPLSFLCLITGAQGLPEVSILHRLMRYMDMPGEEASGFHDQHLGLLGDIRPHQYPTVGVPSTVFHLVGTPVRVPTVAVMTAHMATWEDSTVPLGPFEEDAPETEVV